MNLATAEEPLCRREGGLRGLVVEAGLGHAAPELHGPGPNQALLLQLRLENWSKSSLLQERAVKVLLHSIA